MSYSEYRDLAPIDNIENGDEYIEALNWAFKNKKVKNIALTGPYGAGKSSIIETFLRKDEEDTSGLKGVTHNNSIRSSALKISMATFLKGDSDDSYDEKIELDADEIEKGILKQLFYKVEPNRIPQSRYRKLHAIKERNIFYSTFGALLLITLYMAIFASATYERFIEAINIFLSPLSSGMALTLVVAILWLAIISKIISHCYIVAISKFRVKEIKLPSDTTVQSGADEDSVFNKNLDEIIYFFEETGYRTVFFEDLDRLDNPKIFVHLRELNNLLNNDDAIYKKPIVFVYAVRDDIFSKEDRTKFFDFIIPVIPVINSTNSGEILLQRLQEAKNNGIEHNISQNFVLDIAPFISDMRILQNIYNEFVVYKKTLRTSQQLSLSDEQMFAMMVFKNLYPSDFADIQDEKGILKNAFNNKQKFITSKKKEYQEKIDNQSSVITKAQKDTLKSVKELKYAMLSTFMNGPCTFNCFGIDKWRQPQDTAEVIMRDDYDMKQLLHKKYNWIFFRNQTGYPEDHSIDVKELGMYVERWESIQEVAEKGVEKLRSDLESARKNQHKVASLSLKKLINIYEVDEIFDDEVRDNKLLIFLLRRGYIDENYATYINYFKGTSITKDDMNFILSVKTQSPLEFNYQLTKTPMVVERLQDYEFEQKAIYNFDLLEQLLLSNHSEKLQIFIQQLSDGEDTSWRFIDEFINRTSRQELFIRLLAEKWPGLWKHILSDETMTYERQVMYLQKILTESNSATIKAQNIENCMTNYFEEHRDILQKMVSCPAEKLIASIDCLDVHFTSLNIDGVPHDILESIFDKNQYVINEEMIRTVISFKNAALISEFEEKPYSTLIILQYDHVLQYVQDNMVTFGEKILLTHQNIVDAPEDIVDILNRLEGETELQVELIKRENFRVKNIEDCAYLNEDEEKGEWKHVWDTLLKENKVDVNWKNVIVYWRKYRLSQELMRYISQQAETLTGIDTHGVNDEFIKDFINADFTEEVFKIMLPALRLEKFDLDIASISEPVLNIMIDCNYFEFTVDRYESIAAKSEKLSLGFVLMNQDAYMKLKDDIGMSESLFEQLILNDDFNYDNKCQLFSEYAEDYMTGKIAVHMKTLKMPVSKTIFEAGWNCLDADREKLLLDYFALLNATELQQYFERLGSPYHELSDRSKKNVVIHLPMTDKNRDLAEHLKSIGYITKYGDKDIESKNNATDGQKIQKVLWVRLRQVK